MTNPHREASKTIKYTQQQQEVGNDYLLKHTPEKKEEPEEVLNPSRVEVQEIIVNRVSPERVAFQQTFDAQREVRRRVREESKIGSSLASTASNRSGSQGK